MTNLQINTTQNVQFDCKTVGIGERIIAFLLNVCILYLYAIRVPLIGDAIGYAFEDSWNISHKPNIDTVLKDYNFYTQKI